MPKHQLVSTRSMRHLQIDGDSLKLLLPSFTRKGGVARLIASGMVKLQKILQWVIRSQSLRVERPMSAVHRLNVGGRP